MKFFRPKYPKVFHTKSQQVLESQNSIAATVQSPTSNKPQPDINQNQNSFLIFSSSEDEINYAKSLKRFISHILKSPC